ncbi:hypothetical protein PIB30_016441 [Stylosanthes scabra]|uniref:Uncharacterized protein n=1 Tax=Stylosanthes scabra TaxID=79078 RepID=A0ABU6WAD9_9FABA|nr:hypothetical protein [Stylosanthes scabra]
MAAPGKCAFWLDHEDKPFPWVYWNPEVKDFTVFNLEPLEMAAFKFLVSFPGGLPKRNKFTCQWILDTSDSKLENDLLDVKMKRTKLDNLMAMMADPSRMAPRAVLPTGRPSATVVAAAAAASSLIPAESSSQVPPAPAISATQKEKKQSSKRERTRVVNLEGEEGMKEDPSADLQRKRQKRKGKEDDTFDRVLGDSFFIMFASHFSFGRIPFSRKSMMGFLQLLSTETTSTSWGSLIEGFSLISWIRVRLLSLGLVLANFDRVFARSFSFREMCFTCTCLKEL